MRRLKLLSESSVSTPLLLLMAGDALAAKDTRAAIHALWMRLFVDARFAFTFTLQNLKHVTQSQFIPIPIPIPSQPPLPD